MAFLQEAIVDTLTSRIDSLAGGESEAADTGGVFTDITRDIGDAGRALAAGEWDLFVSVVVDRLVSRIIDFIPDLLTAIIIFLFLYVGYRVAGSVLHRVLDRSRRVDRGLQVIMMKTFRIVALTLIVVMVLDQFGFAIRTLLAGLGIAGIAVGFAARDTLENFISGVTILIDRPFRVGDNIEVEDIYGTVEEITLRSTRIRTLNNKILVMPNVQMINQKLVNHTMLEVVRIEVPFGIAYKEYPQQAREAVMKTIEGDRRLHPDYKCDVVVTQLNDSSVDMVLRLYLSNPKLEVPVRFEYIEKVREALRSADIEIPFPHLQLFIDEAKAFEESYLLQPKAPGSRPQA